MLCELWTKALLLFENDCVCIVVAFDISTSIRLLHNRLTDARWRCQFLFSTFLSLIYAIKGGIRTIFIQRTIRFLNIFVGFAIFSPD